MMPLQVNFALNTFYSGPQAWFFLADDLGFFREEGIEVHFSPGDTAANVVPRLADRNLSIDTVRVAPPADALPVNTLPVDPLRFDCGFGDVNALIEWAARHDQACAQVIYCLHNASPYTIAVPANSPAQSVLDLRHRPISSHPNDAALKLLPELALRCGFSAQDFEIELCSESHPDMVRDMVQKQRWAAMFGFVNTLRAAAMERGIDPDQDLRFFEFRQLIPELYGAGLMVARRFASEHADYLPGLVRAVNRGLQACLLDIDAAIEAVAKRDPTIDRRANRARLTGTLALEMAHPEGGLHGIGYMDPRRIQNSIDLIVAAKNYPHRPKPEDIFTAQYLPPATQRVTELARPLLAPLPTAL
jgi:NitT/TauT family transport system substrate-binding protein